MLEGLFNSGSLAGILLNNDVTRRAMERAGIRLGSSPPMIALSDRRFIAGAVGIAKQLVPAADVSVEAQPDGFRVSGLVDGQRVSAVVDLERIDFTEGMLTVVVRTPNSISLDERRVAQLFTGVLVRMLGGTSIARRVLSENLPDWIRWDGSRAIASVALDSGKGFPAGFANIRVSGRAARSGGWTTIEMSQEGVLAAVATVIFARLTSDTTT